MDDVEKPFGKVEVKENKQAAQTTISFIQIREGKAGQCSPLDLSKADFKRKFRVFVRIRKESSLGYRNSIEFEQVIENDASGKKECQNRTRSLWKFWINLYL